MYFAYRRSQAIKRAPLYASVVLCERTRSLPSTNSFHPLCLWSNIYLQFIEKEFICGPKPIWEIIPLRIQFIDRQDTSANLLNRNTRQFVSQNKLESFKGETVCLKSMSCLSEMWGTVLQSCDFVQKAGLGQCSQVYAE